MDRPSQEPPEPPESPLSFPVEAPKVAGVEPGAGSPLSFPVEVEPAGDPLDFPVETPVPPSGDLLAFPAQASLPSSGNPLDFPAQAAVPPSASPLDFPAQAAASPSASPLEFPAQAAAPPSANPLEFPAQAAAPPSANPLDFPAQSVTPPSAFPAQAPQAPPPATPLPFPVAHLPGAAPTPAPHEPPPPAAPEAPAGTSRLRRFLPPALTAAAALMAAGGLFLPLFRLQQHVNVRQRYFDAQLTVTQTAWGSRIEIPGQEATDQAASPLGIPVILAVVLLAVAAFTAFARPRRGRWLIGAGAFFTGGVVLTVGMSGLGWSAMADGMDLEVTTTAGMWLLIAATASAAVAAVVAALPGKSWADPTLAYADTPTPPSGVAITVLPPEEPG